MNNTVLKNIAYVASGALCGALGAYLVTKKVLSEKFEAELQAYKDADGREVVLLKNESVALREMIDIYEKAGLNFETAKAMAETNKKLEEAKEEKLLEKETRDTYTRLINYATKTEEKQSMKTNVENFTPSEKVKEETPYLISVDQFAGDRDDFRKVSCTLYTEDCVLCETSHNEKIEAKHIGQENVDMMLNSDIDIMYVRNEYLEIDYEIEKYEGNYAYEVLGEESLNE